MLFTFVALYAIALIFAGLITGRSERVLEQLKNTALVILFASISAAIVGVIVSFVTDLRFWRGVLMPVLLLALLLWVTLIVLATQRTGGKAAPGGWGRYASAHLKLPVKIFGIACAVLAASLSYAVSLPRGLRALIRLFDRSSSFLTQFSSYAFAGSFLIALIAIIISFASPNTGTGKSPWD